MVFLVIMVFVLLGVLLWYIRIQNEIDSLEGKNYSNEERGMVKPSSVQEILELSKQLDLVQTHMDTNMWNTNMLSSGWFALECVKLLSKEVENLRKELEEVKGIK